MRDEVSEAESSINPNPNRFERVVLAESVEEKPRASPLCLPTHLRRPVSPYQRFAAIHAELMTIAAL
jgi:hypothetical protein